MWTLLFLSNLNKITFSYRTISLKNLSKQKVSSIFFNLILQEASAIPFAALTAWRGLMCTARLEKGYGFVLRILS